jgi:hypothetical protein
MTALDQFTDTLMEKLYPPNSIPHYVSLDIFIPWVRRQIMNHIKIHDEHSDSIITASWPFTEKSNEINIAIPESVTQYFENVRNLARRKAEGTHIDGDMDY